MFAARKSLAIRSAWKLIPMLLLTTIFGLAVGAHAEKKKKEAAPPEEPIIKRLDYSKIVWPNPPAITRVKYVDYYAADKVITKETKKKSGWMERMGGAVSGADATADKPFFQLAQPYGIATDSKNNLYVVDSKVGAIFVWNIETKDLNIIGNGRQARFSLITGIAIDDGDRIFVSDSVARHVLVFSPTIKVESTLREGLSSPAGLAVDNENRFLYVADTDLDQVLVYDLDTLAPLRKIGKAGTKHESTEPGLFSRPTNCAVDADGNLYVTDTFNNRVEIFDADGNFIRAWGKHGDGPGYFARPKGIAIDKDGHVWVADTVQDRVQVYTPEGSLLLWLGGHGILPGQFAALQGLAIDKKNRVFTSEQLPGRVQMFHYITDEEALAEKAKRDAEPKKPAGGKPATPPVGKPAATEKSQPPAAH